MNQFNDLIVLELASVLAGPGVGQFFAELGARVIKVENIKTEGDVTRSWKSAYERTDDRSAYFCSVNWGKQSIALDLASPEGLDIVSRLARQAHIVIASFKPGDAAKFGVDYASLSAANPALIYGQVTGYGSNNPRVGYDAIVQAEGGFMFMNGEPGGKSLKMPVALIDILAGHHLKEALLLAMLEKNHTGRGKLVEVSLLQAAVASLANQASNYLVGHISPGKQGSAHPNISPYGETFKTRDGKEILLAVGTDKQFHVLCRLLAIDDTATDARFASNLSRVQNRLALHAILSAAISGIDRLEFMKLLVANNIPAGEIRSIPEVLEDPAIAEIMMSDGHLRGIRTFVATGNDSIFPHLLPPPHLGEHTDSVLRDMLRFSLTDVVNLRKKGLIR